MNEFGSEYLRMPESRRRFLEQVYLEQEYIVPENLESSLQIAITEIQRQNPEIMGLTLTGGLANGSNVIRKSENPQTASDIDFYFFGKTIPHTKLQQASEIVVRTTQLRADGVLNGKDLHYYLNVDELSRHIEREEYDLLALPFQCSFGKAPEVQKQILHHIIAHPDKQKIWDGICDQHVQSLSLHHGTWDDEFNQTILDNYYPKKIEKFQLPETPEECLKELGQSSK